MLCSISSAQRQLSRRVRRRRRRRAGGVARVPVARSIEKQREDARAAEADRSPRRGRGHAAGGAASAHGARVVSQAPAGGALERAEAHPQGWVHDIYERARGASALLPRALGAPPPRGPGLKSQADEGAVDISEEGGGGGDGGDGAAAGGTQSPRRPAVGDAALAASAVRMLCAATRATSALFRRARQMLWRGGPSTRPTGTDDVVRRVVAHDGGAAVVARGAARGVAARGHRRPVERGARVAVVRAAAAAMAWKAVARRAREDETRMEHAAQCTRPRWSAWARMRARRRHRAEMVDATLSGFEAMQRARLHAWRETAVRRGTSLDASCAAPPTRAPPAGGAASSVWSSGARARGARPRDAADDASRPRGPPRHRRAGGRRAQREAVDAAEGAAAVRGAFAGRPPVAAPRRRRVARRPPPRADEAPPDRLARPGALSANRCAASGRVLAAASMVGVAKRGARRRAAWATPARRRRADAQNRAAADGVRTAALWANGAPGSGGGGGRAAHRQAAAPPRGLAPPEPLLGDVARRVTSRAERLAREDRLEELRRRCRDVKRDLLRRRAITLMAVWLSRAELRDWMRRGRAWCTTARRAKAIRRWVDYTERRHEARRGAEYLAFAAKRRPKFRKRWGLRMWRRWCRREPLRERDRRAARDAADRQRRVVADAFAYWSAEASWRQQRQKWLQRQVRMQHELADGDGRRWAQRLLNIKPDDERAWSEQNLRAVQHGREVLERALRRAKVGSYRSSDAYWLDE